MPIDGNPHGTAGLSAPAEHAFAIDAVKSDTVDLVYLTRAIYVGGAGNLKVTLAGGETVTYEGLTAGSRHAIRATRVWAAGTTATKLIGEY